MWYLNDSDFFYDFLIKYIAIVLLQQMCSILTSTNTS